MSSFKKENFNFFLIVWATVIFRKFQTFRVLSNPFESFESFRIFWILSKNGDSKHFLEIHELHKITMINTYINSKEHLIKIDHSQNTRQKVQGSFKVRKYSNTFGKHTLPTLVPSIINEIPHQLIEIKNCQTRKRKIKEFFLNKSWRCQILQI